MTQRNTVTADWLSHPVAPTLRPLRTPSAQAAERGGAHEEVSVLVPFPQAPSPALA